MDSAPLLRLHSLRGQAQEGNWRTDGQCKPGKPGKAVPETITDVWLRMTSSLFCVCFFRSFGLDGFVMQPSRTHTFWNSGCQVYGFVMICQTLLMYSGLCRRSKRYLHFVFTTHTVTLGAGTSWYAGPRWYDELWRGRKHAPAGLDDEPLAVLFRSLRVLKWDLQLCLRYDMYLHTVSDAHMYLQKDDKIYKRIWTIAARVYLLFSFIFSPLSQLGFRHGFHPPFA